MSDPKKAFEDFLARGQAAQTAVGHVLDAVKVKAAYDGTAPLCHPKDVTDQVVADWNKQHGHS
jgi:hypothetical protein